MPFNKNFTKSRQLNILLIGIIVCLTGGIFILHNTASPKVVEAGKTDLRDMQYTFRTVAEHVLPVSVELRVVEIKTQEIPEGYNWSFNFIEPEIDDDQSPDIHEYEAEGLGSGVIVRRNGKTYYVLTNRHVLGSADRITVRLHDKTEMTGIVVGTDDRKDLGLISFESDDDLPVAVLGDSDELLVGDWVLAVGSPSRL